ncbi:plasmid mobilization relaxosome protein MobC [Campylobacter coli]
MKTIIKTLRLENNQWEQIEIKLKESELSFSSFALASMLGQKTIKRKQTPINRDFIAELSKWGNNLNQVAKHLNSNKGGLDRVGLEMLSRIENHLKELRKVIE